MLYAVIIHGAEAVVDNWTQDEEDEVMARHNKLRQDLEAAGRLGPAVRLGPTAAARFFRNKSVNPITDGPYAETKEQLLGFYIVDCATPDDALDVARRLAFDTSAFEVRPIVTFLPGGLKAG